MIVVVLIVYVLVCVLCALIAFGCFIGIWCELEDDEYGRVFWLVILLVLTVLMWLSMTDAVFELGLFDAMFEWLRSEV